MMKKNHIQSMSWSSAQKLVGVSDVAPAAEFSSLITAG
jgi:hypothetical protein